MNDIKNYDILRLKKDEYSYEEDIVVVEHPFTIYLNDKELITLLCSPKSLEYLAVGFLNSEGFLSSYDDIENIRIDTEKGMAYVYTKNKSLLSEKLHGKRTITTGCGKGTIFYNVMDSFKTKKINNSIPVDIENIKRLVKEFNKKSELFLNTGGVHSCALCNKDEMIAFEEDIGRHNALDKILGKALIDQLDLSDKIVLSSGRISSEILIKIGKRQVPIIVSRSAPTSLAVDIAKELNITLIGFVRGEKMNIYTNFPSFSF
ncbi:formate dehydrogenase accessory sulfurtransferase FdhD [Brassicibacter mesophilus]|uniref:formate dehydrogenase accessory sulfurtransferase FdhD n=1 Tax=Brassicibacter mesophilus TaxID=745119 RepID=UPI003D25B598